MKKAKKVQKLTFFGLKCDFSAFLASFRFSFSSFYNRFYFLQLAPSSTHKRGYLRLVSGDTCNMTSRWSGCHHHDHQPRNEPLPADHQTLHISIVVFTKVSQQCLDGILSIKQLFLSRMFLSSQFMTSDFWSLKNKKKDKIIYLQ